MAYFSNLFENINEIYFYLEQLVLLVIGGFYLATMGFQKLQVYLETRGESDSNQAYMHKFLVPVLLSGIFFIPIPEGTNSKDQATIVQNVIRFSAGMANDIADMVSAKGGATYMNKIYASVGGGDKRTEEIYRKNLEEAKFTKQEANKAYEQKCIPRFGEISKEGIPYSNMTEEELTKHFQKYKIDFNQVAQKSDIKFETCMWLEKAIWQSNAKIEQAQNNLNGIKNYYKNGELQKNLKFIDDYLARRENELGWYNSIILSSTALLVEIQDKITTNFIQKNNVETTTEKTAEAIKGNMSKGVTKEKSGDDSSYLSSIISKYAAWFLIPGTSNIYELVRDAGDAAAEAGGALVEMATFGGVKVAAKLIARVSGVFLGKYVVETAIEKLPIIAIAVAGMIVASGYLITLCKYFYISPFVVAFALTTKRLDKITEFLITGIALFFEPVLIVIFIFLALFLHTLINEFFIFVSIEQFNAIPVGVQDYWTAGLTMGVIKTLLKIFGSLASVYISWKLIISGAKWTLNMLGIDGSKSELITDNMVGQLGKRSFI